MSNQVYINDTDKYLPSVGINLFKPSVFITVEPATTGVVIWDTEIIVSSSVPADFAINTTTGQIEIIRSGLYYIGATVELTDGIDPVNNDINYSVTILYSPPLTAIPEVILGTVLNRIPARGVAVGSNSFREYVSTAVYCYPETLLTINVANFSGTNLAVQSAASQLMVQRIA